MRGRDGGDGICGVSGVGSWVRRGGGGGKLIVKVGHYWVCFSLLPVFVNREISLRA